MNSTMSSPRSSVTRRQSGSIRWRRCCSPSSPGIPAPRPSIHCSAMLTPSRGPRGCSASTTSMRSRMPSKRCWQVCETRGSSGQESPLRCCARPLRYARRSPERRSPSTISLMISPLARQCWPTAKLAQLSRPLRRYPGRPRPGQRSSRRGSLQRPCQRYPRLPRRACLRRAGQKHQQLPGRACPRPGRLTRTPPLRGRKVPGRRPSAARCGFRLRRSTGCLTSSVR